MYDFVRHGSGRDSENDWHLCPACKLNFKLLGYPSSQRFVCVHRNKILVQ